MSTDLNTTKVINLAVGEVPVDSLEHTFNHADGTEMSLDGWTAKVDWQRNHSDGGETGEMTASAAGGVVSTGDFDAGITAKEGTVVLTFWATNGSGKTVASPKWYIKVGETPGPSFS